MNRAFCVKGIVLLLLFLMAVFSFTSCGRSEIEIPDRIVANRDATPLPEIKIGKDVLPFSRFRYENEDGFVYVFEGQIFFTETAPASFETTLTLYDKEDGGRYKSVTVVREKINVTEAKIECLSKGIFPGESAEYRVVTTPEGAYIGDAELTVDKPQYVDSLSTSEITFSADAPLGEIITLRIAFDNGVVAMQEFAVTDKIIEISTPEQMELLRVFPYGYFRLVNNINMSEYSWTPVTNFYGLFDGNGYSISGINIDSTSTNCAGFLCQENFGKIRNLKISNSELDYATANDVSPYHNLEKTVLMAGVVCGANHGKIENVVVENCLMKQLQMGSLIHRHNYVIIAGPICGINFGVVSKCGAIGNSIKLDCSSAYEGAYVSMGGLLGTNEGYVDYSYSYDNELHGDLYGVNTPSIAASRLFCFQGGLCGQSCGTFYQCVSAGNRFSSTLSGTEEAWKTDVNADFLARFDAGKINECYALYTGIAPVAEVDCILVTSVSKISLATCGRFSSDIWIEDGDYLIINYDWKYSVNEQRIYYP